MFAGVTGPSATTCANAAISSRSSAHSRGLPSLWRIGRRHSLRRMGSPLEAVVAATWYSMRTRYTGSARESSSSTSGSKKSTAGAASTDAASHSSDARTPATSAEPPTSAEAALSAPRLSSTAPQSPNAPTARIHSAGELRGRRSIARRRRRSPAHASRHARHTSATPGVPPSIARISTSNSGCPSRDMAGEVGPAEAAGQGRVGWRWRCRRRGACRARAAASMRGCSYPFVGPP